MLSKATIIKILRYRGFRIKHIISKDKYYLSRKYYLKNDFKNEKNYLNDILTKVGIGYINNKREIIITDLTKKDELNNELFKDYTGVYGDESLCVDYDWEEFSINELNFIPTYGLDPHIARYVNALRRCGMVTTGSCDGNHDRFNDQHRIMYVAFLESASHYYHEFLWKNLLSDKFNLKWLNNKFNEVSITNDRQEKYDELNKVAIYLHKNHELILKIKFDALNDIPKEVSDDEEKLKLFLSNVNLYFDKYKNKFKDVK